MVRLRDVSGLLQSCSSTGRARRACRSPMTVREDRHIATKPTASWLHGRLTCARSTGRSSSTRWSRRHRAEHLLFANVKARDTVCHPQVDSLLDLARLSRIRSTANARSEQSRSLVAALIEKARAGHAPASAAVLQCNLSALWRTHVADRGPSRVTRPAWRQIIGCKTAELSVIHASALDCSPLPSSPRTSPPLAPAWRVAASDLQRMQT